MVLLKCLRKSTPLYSSETCRECPRARYPYESNFNCLVISFKDSRQLLLSATLTQGPYRSVTAQKSLSANRGQNVQSKNAALIGKTSSHRVPMTLPIESFLLNLSPQNNSPLGSSSVHKSDYISTTQLHSYAPAFRITLIKATID